MEKVDELIQSLALNRNISLEDIPKMDLYIDQVIELFEQSFLETKRKEDEKILTKTMINNYAKGKLFFPIKSKKYTREHIMLISLIYHLKGGLSINDIKDSLNILNEEIISNDLDLETFYESYLHLYERNAKAFQHDLSHHVEAVKTEMKKVNGKNQSELERSLLIASLISMSNFYRRAAELLVDEIKVEDEPNKKKEK